MKVHPTCNSQISRPNFVAMKSSQFKGVDYICMRKLKAPIEKFDTIKDFQRWALGEIRAKNYNYPARTEKFDKLRNDLLNKWLQVFCWQPQYPFAFALVFINEICKNLKPDNDDIPEIYNQTALKKTYDEIQTKDNDTQFRFLDIYKNHLGDILEGNSIPDNGWLIIPSLNNDEINYERNVTKLQVLSHRTWCTKTPYASMQLMYADFHLLLQDKKTRAIIRVMEDNVVEEIQSIGNHGPTLEDLPLIEAYISENNFVLHPNVQKMIEWVKSTQ